LFTKTRTTGTAYYLQSSNRKRLLVPTAFIANMLQSFEPTHTNTLHYASVPTPPISTSVSPSSASSTVVKTAPFMFAPKNHHILIVTGPAGCGKSTVAKFLADRYGFVYIEGDDVSVPLQNF
jgi:gluconokinase